MKYLYLVNSVVFMFFVSNFNLKAQHNIIPIPVSFVETGHQFVFDKEVNLPINSNNEVAQKYIDQLSEFLNGLGIEVRNSRSKKHRIDIMINQNYDSIIGDEGYKLIVSNDIVSISANEVAGIFNGIQTLKQMLPIKASTKRELSISGCEIVDFPRFKWRGLMLDVSRHFFSVDEVKSYINQMSAYKFNVLHWHLTDDQGWRIEIKSLPRLTTVGAWRVDRFGKFGESRKAPLAEEKATYGGFYTQEQIKDIVKYAQDRNITIVPEVDMPGHSMAALAAYPELSVNQEPKYVIPGTKIADWYGGGKFKLLIENTLNPIDEQVYTFIDKVFTEVAQLFPGDYIHMGGDEAYHGYWEENKEVQEFMKDHHIKNSHELQSYFVGRVERIINSKGKKMIGWDEILEGGLAEGATVMSWRGMKGGIAAAKLGHEVVMTPTTYAYLDYMQGDKSVENRIYAKLSLKKTYKFDPLPKDIDRKYILGGQANLWTESIRTMPFAFYMTYPRAFAIAESVWSPLKNKDWASFIKRTQYHFKRFDALKTNISKAVYEPIIHIYKADDKLMCKLNNNIPETTIYYSVDNTYPVQFAMKYKRPFSIPNGDLNLRTQTFLNGKAIGRELIISRSDLVKRVKK